MHQTATNSPSPASPSFAGLLAALTAPTPRTAWNNDDLADDVATLSYEHALRTHSRFKAQDDGEWAMKQESDSVAAAFDRANLPKGSAETAPQPTAAACASHYVGQDASPDASYDARRSQASFDAGDSASDSAANRPAIDDTGDAPFKSSANTSAIFDHSKKCASITIRLSKEECDQLRRRASQAGLTVSAYLRSCTFEAETLRAQVKNALAELRTAASTEKQSEPPAIHRAPTGWLTRLMPRWHGPQRVARA